MVFPHRREQAQVLQAPEQPRASFPAADFEGWVAAFVFF